MITVDAVSTLLTSVLPASVLPVSVKKEKWVADKLVTRRVDAVASLVRNESLLILDA